MPENPDDLLTTAQAAELLNVRRGTLEIWRCTRRYPLPFVQVGRNIRYRRRDVIRFIESRTVNCGATA